MFEQFGNAKKPAIARMDAMYRSISMMHLLMLGQKLDRVQRSLWPMDELWALDPSLGKLALRNGVGVDLLDMFAAFRQDVSDLHAILGRELFGQEEIERDDVAISRRH